YSTPNSGTGEAGFPTAVILSPSLKILSIGVGADTFSNIEKIILADLAADPSSRVFELIALTDSYGLQPGIAESLDAKLKNALQALEPSNTIEACNLLNAFTNEVQAQSGKHLSIEQAAPLTEKA